MLDYYTANEYPTPGCTMPLIIRSQPETSSRPCPSCAPGLPVCVSCYLDMRDLERLEDDTLSVMEGYADR